MVRTIWQQARPAALMLFWMTLVTGLAYPLAMTGLGQALFPWRAGGSLLTAGDGSVVGSALVGQRFAADRHFHGRPSATEPFAYNAMGSQGSNLGPSNPELARNVAERARVWAASTGNAASPMDLLTTSASGLDPHISPAAARLQAPRVARARGLAQAVAERLVAEHTEAPLWGFWGEARVNVLELNLALDALASKE